MRDARSLLFGVMDLPSKQCIAILLLIVGFFPLHFLLIHGSGPDICNPRDPELVEGEDRQTLNLISK